MTNKESIALTGINADETTVIVTKEGDQLDLTQVADAFLSFLNGMGYIYVESIDFYCGNGVVHGSTY